MDLALSLSFIDLIMACVTSCNMSIIWNSEPISSFSISPSLRQGNPISPYLFVFCMERLSHLINFDVDKKL